MKKGRCLRLENGKRLKDILTFLEREYPCAKTALDHGSPFQMLVATILSAQTTDARVNMVTPGLFNKFPTAADMSHAGIEEIEREIRSVNFYRNKARNIRKLSGILVEKWSGKVPGSMAELVSLPGVARKTANVVMGEAFGKSEGIVVDTHVKRLAWRLGLTKNTLPEKVEADLMECIPRNRWISFSMQLILHGRKVCNARKPLCEICGLAGCCPHAAEIRRDKNKNEKDQP